jgi:integrase
MPKVDPKAVLERDDVRRGRAVAHKMGLLEGTIFDWMYEFGARASEPGLQTLRDVDLRAARARPIHLKHGQAQDWHALLAFCRESLPKWLEARKPGRDQAQTLFPAETVGPCEACGGEGQRALLRLDVKTGKRYRGAEKYPCHHCGATGRRLGISRFLVHEIITTTLGKAGVPKGRRHPHVLRHSIITHLLESGIAPAVVQDRVGHTQLATTLGYARATRAAAAQMEAALGDIYK